MCEKIVNATQTTRDILKKRTAHTWSMNSHKVGLKTRIYYVIYWLFLEICVDIQMKWQ